ncbi:MAG: sensor histidine kinase, partial [Saprospiraceae bacterium]|nr:sensor histidine kinase [Saprospiraceae bacterium]
MNIEDLIVKRSTEKTYRIVSHILFWILLFSSSYFLVKFSFNPYRESPFAYLTPLRNTLGLALTFYPLMYFVVPQFLKKKNWLFLISSIIFLTFLYVVFEAISEKIVFNYCASCLETAMEFNPDYVQVIQKSTIENILFKGSNIQLFLQFYSGLILPIAIKMSIGYFQFYTRSLELEKEKVNFELNFLKAQVNPHFLFNTLNNLYGLVMLGRTENSMEAINRLSEFLRYTLESATQKTIHLADEIKLIENYIELEKLRLNHTEVKLDISVGKQNLTLPPLLFIPLLENAFKYTIDQKGSKIHIQIKVVGQKLYFSIQNGFDETVNTKLQGGLGLRNLQKRLKLYFQNDYEYTVS